MTPTLKDFGEKKNTTLSKVSFKFFPNPRILRQLVNSSSMIKILREFANVGMSGLRCSVSSVYIVSLAGSRRTARGCTAPVMAGVMADFRC